MEQLADLDELVLRCRSSNARRYIGEAVSCYRGGAQRSAIVATWIALVYDFIDKLRELELAGDANARSLVERIETIRKNNDVSESLKFERNFLDDARDKFELISQQEYADLQRLLEDRNRCAHPSLNADGEAYQPPSELARYHITNTVLHVLQHQPAQGKAALERVVRDVSSPLFPRTRDEALVQLRGGPLGRARHSLVKNAVVVLAKMLLLDPAVDRPFAERLGASLAAISEMYRDLSEHTFREKATDLCKRAFEDAREPAVLAAVEVLPSLWSYIREEAREHLLRYMREGAVPTAVTADAFSTPVLKDLALVRVESMTARQLADLISHAGPQREFIDAAIKRYADSLGFEDANNRATSLMLPLVPLLNEEHVNRIARAIVDNNQIRGSYRIPVVMTSIRAAGVITPEALSRIITEHHLEALFPALVVPPPREGEPQLGG